MKKEINIPVINIKQKLIKRTILISVFFALFSLNLKAQNKTVPKREVSKTYSGETKKLKKNKPQPFKKSTKKEMKQEVKAEKKYEKKELKEELKREEKAKKINKD